MIVQYLVVEPAPAAAPVLAPGLPAGLHPGLAADPVPVLDLPAVPAPLLLAGSNTWAAIAAPVEEQPFLSSLGNSKPIPASQQPLSKSLLA